MTNLNYLILAFLLFQISYAQVGIHDDEAKIKILERGQLIETFKLRSNTVFVINGVPYSENDSLILNEKLRNISQIISGITSIKNEGQIGMGRNDVILISYASILKPKIVRKKYRKAKKLFTDNYFGSSQHIFTDGTDPVLYVDNKKVFHFEAKKVIQNLKEKEIADIIIKSEPQEEHYLGQNAKNGMVIIWTKRGLSTKVNN